MDNSNKNVHETNDVINKLTPVPLAILIIIFYKIIISIFILFCIDLGYNFIIVLHITLSKMYKMYGIFEMVVMPV